MSVLMVVIIVVTSVSMKLDHSIVSVHQVKYCLMTELVAKVSNLLCIEPVFFCLLTADRTSGTNVSDIKINMIEKYCKM